MQINSIQFIFYFLPPFLAVYYLLPYRYRPAALTVLSLIFYWLASDMSLLGPVVLIILTAGAYFAQRARGRWAVPAAVSALTAALAFFKLYRGGALLPVALSFYVFQLIACVIDVRRGKVEPERDALSFAAGIFMFPKLLSGPLVEPESLQRQMHRPHRTALAFHMGVQELILGLGLKVILADRVGGAWNTAGIMGYESVSTPFMWLAVVAWCMRLYFDFYGYSLMAVGLGHMLGFHLPMNFLEPYSSKSVSEFFRRWHATLGRWFRDYVYIPLGGNRRGNGRTVLNLAIVWALTGLWHGVGGAYLMWAAILLALILLERFWLRKYLDRSKVLCHFYLVLVIILSWVPFAAGSVEGAVAIYSRLFGLGEGMGGMDDFLALGREYAPLMLSGVFLATPVPKKIWLRVKDYAWTDAALFALFLVSAYFMATSAQDPFLYFKF